MAAPSRSAIRSACPAPAWFLALGIQARIAADAADYDAMIEYFAQQLFVARALRMQPIRKAHLYGLSYCSSAMHNAACILHEHDVPADAARELRTLIQQDDGGREFGHVLEGTRFQLLDHVQRTFTDDGDRNGRFLPAQYDEMENEYVRQINQEWNNTGFIVEGLPEPETSISKMRNIGTFLHADRRQTVEAVERIVQNIRDVLGDDQSNWLEKQDAIEDVLATQGVDVPFVTPPLVEFAYDVGCQALLEIHQRGVIILSAIEEYEATYDQLPTSLDDLVPTILEDLPKVPITGNDFLYRVLDEPDAHGRRFLLYIPGAGGVDNDGRVAEVRIRDILTDDGIGSEYDYILNRVRE
jgi:hypothetical protein